MPGDTYTIVDSGQPAQSHMYMSPSGPQPPSTTAAPDNDTYMVMDTGTPEQPGAQESIKTGVIPTDKYNAPTQSPTLLPDTPEWAGKHPNLYGLLGAGRAIARTGIEGAGLVGGEALGGPIGAGVGLAAGARLNETLGLNEGQPQFDSSVPQAKQNSTDVGNMVSGAAMTLGGKAVSYLGNKVAPVLSEMANSTPLGKLITSPSEAYEDAAATVKDAAQSQLNGIIDDGINAIRPTVKGRKNSYTQMTDGADNARTAVKQIINENDAGNLQLKDPGTGEDVDHSLPQTVDEFAQAIDQGKKLLWQRVESSLNDAEQSGTTIPLTPLSKALMAESAKPKYDLRPGARTELEGLANRFDKRSSVSPLQAEDMIQEINQTLAPAYANGTANRTVDARIAQYLRDGQEKVLNSIGGDSVAPLKKTYGAYKSIEKDVLHRAIIHNRANPNGFFDLSDVYTIPEILGGVASGNPLSVLKGTIGLAVKSAKEIGNNPDTRIKRMFDKANELYKRPGAPAPVVATAPVVPEPPKPSRIRTPLHLPKGPTSYYDNTLGAKRPE